MCGGIQGQLFKSQTFFISCFSESFLCLHEGTVSFCLSSLARELFPRRCGVSPSLLTHFIAVGNYGSCGSLVKRAKICSQKKSTSTAVAAASLGAVTRFLLGLASAPSQPCRGRTLGEIPSGSDLENYWNGPKGARKEEEGGWDEACSETLWLPPKRHHAQSKSIYVMSTPSTRRYL